MSTAIRHQIQGGLLQCKTPLLAEARSVSALNRLYLSTPNPSRIDTVRFGHQGKVSQCVPTRELLLVGNISNVAHYVSATTLAVTPQSSLLLQSQRRENDLSPVHTLICHNFTLCRSSFVFPLPSTWTKATRSSLAWSPQRRVVQLLPRKMALVEGISHASYSRLL